MSFLEDADRGITRFPVGLRTNGLEHLVQVLDLPVTLLLMGEQHFLQLFTGYRLHQLGKSPLDLVLRVIHVGKFIQEKIFECFHSSRLQRSTGGGGREFFPQRLLLGLLPK